MKKRLLYGMAPAILFIFLEELLQTAMEWLWQQAGAYGGIYTHGSGPWNSFLTALQSVEPGDRQALSIAVAMLGALPWIFGSVQRSIRSWEGIAYVPSRKILRPDFLSRFSSPAGYFPAGNSSRAVQFPDRHRPAEDSGGRSAAAACARWMLICICLSLGINILILLLTESGASGSSGNILLAAAVYGMVSPFAEEAVFRGSLLGNLRKCMPLGQAILLSALVFGIYHGNPAQIFYAFVMGMAFGAAYVRCGHFAVPFVLHGMVNLVVLLFSYTGVTVRLVSPLWGTAFLLVAATGIIFEYSDTIAKNSK